MKITKQTGLPTQSHLLENTENRLPLKVGNTLSRTSRNQKGSHCEERSDVAIQIISSKAF